MAISPFKGLKDKFVEFKIGNEVIKARPVVADAEAFILMKKEMTPEDASRISKILIDMIQRANSDEEKADIEAYVAQHYGELLLQAGVAFGFTTAEKVEETKKKLMGEV